MNEWYRECFIVITCEFNDLTVQHTGEYGRVTKIKAVIVPAPEDRAILQRKSSTSRGGALLPVLLR